MIDPNTRFLVIDDANAVVVMVKRYLRELGVLDISIASNGREALDRLTHAVDTGTPIDFIISDLNMPDMNGLELLEQCGQDSRLSTTPFLMLTSESDRALVIKAVILGVSDYLLKPFSPQSLEEKIISIQNRQKS